MSFARRLPSLPSCAWPLLLGLLCCACTTARETYPLNSDDFDRAVSLPATFEDVWYRPQDNPTFGIPYAAWGTLTVSADELRFTHSKGGFTIPVSRIDSVVWRDMTGDNNNEWAVVTFSDNGGPQVAAFTAANGWRYHTSNRQMYSALVRAAGPAGGN